MIIVPTKEFKSKPHAILWFEDFQEKQPEIKLDIYRNVKRSAHYVVGQLDHVSSTHIVFVDGLMYERNEWIKSFI